MITHASSPSRAPWDHADRARRVLAEAIADLLGLRDAADLELSTSGPHGSTVFLDEGEAGDGPEVLAIDQTAARLVDALNALRYGRLSHTKRRTTPARER